MERPYKTVEGPNKKMTYTNKDIQYFIEPGVWSWWFSGWLIWSWMGLTMAWSPPSIFLGVFGHWLLFCLFRVRRCLLPRRHQVLWVAWLTKKIFPSVDLFSFGRKHPPTKPLRLCFPQQSSLQDPLAKAGSQASACVPREAASLCKLQPRP